MLFTLLFFGTVLGLPTDEFHSIARGGDLPLQHDPLLKQIVPSGYSPHVSSENPEDNNDTTNNSDTKCALPNVDDKESEWFKALASFVERGITAKGLIFNVYEDDMRNAAIALFRLLREAWIYNKSDYRKIKKWASDNVNSDMYDYVSRLVALYSRGNRESFAPPFFLQPNYFFNGETIVKALYIKNNLHDISETVLTNLQATKASGNVILINTNYSGWNIPLNGCDEQISYFKDDVALSSYYYGIQLLHPFWMPNEELDQREPKHAEHYYFVHQQLFARYRLEQEHLGTNILKKMSKNCDSDYNPYLYYKNGLAFPTRSSVVGNLEESLTYMKSIDIAIRECIHRGIVIVENGTFIKVAQDNYINLVTKLIRANLDSVKSAKIVRSIFGYGNNGYPINRHNPTPSALHHPQTTLRDPAYWVLMEKGLDYFSEYTNYTGFDMSEYETDEFNIEVPEHSEVTTVFKNTYFSLQEALGGSENQNNIFYARQRRLNHLPFRLNFTVESKANKKVTVRLFLGPQCDIDNCWNLYYRFFELDCYRKELDEGVNKISWNAQSSDRYASFDDKLFMSANDNTVNRFDIYKFPENLIFPKGLKEGLNLTAFVIITEVLPKHDSHLTSFASKYRSVLHKLDDKPLGFPFHKQVKLSDSLLSNTASNFKFFNVTVFHKRMYTSDQTGYFSPHLY